MRQGDAGQGSVFTCRYAGIGCPGLLQSLFGRDGDKCIEILVGGYPVQEVLGQLDTGIFAILQRPGVGPEGFGVHR